MPAPPTPQSTAAILVAAGRGERMGGPPKQWRDLAGRPVAAHAAQAFRDAGIARILLVIQPQDAGFAQALGLPWVAGGDSRTASVRAALAALADDPPAAVLIHDAARPLVSPGLIGRVLGALADHPGAAPALPVTDALWRGDLGRVAGVQDRAGLWRAQTPQGFWFAPLLAAYAAHAAEAADDVAVARAAGLDVAIVPGDENNLKLTWPGDMDRAAQALRGRAMDIRTGNGFDVHAFGPGDHVWLGGVRIPHSHGLVGHSDADVAMHALTDAIYGALALGDIGQHFPPSDPQWRGAASRIFLAHAADQARARGFRLTHCDVTLICERPRIGPHAPAMREALAGILGVEIERASVKATTSERLGFTGREEGIAAIATATLVAP